MSEIPDVYEAYRVAGELYGRLKHELGVGELVMREHSSAMFFDWTFMAKGVRYSSSEAVLFVTLFRMNSVESFAKWIAGRWKDQARRIA